MTDADRDLMGLTVGMGRPMTPENQQFINKLQASGSLVLVYEMDGFV